jgi:hypothetical protein
MVVSECVSPMALVDSRTQESQRGRNSLSWFGLSVPYVWQLMTLVLKNTQNLGVTTKCKGQRERFGRGSLGADPRDTSPPVEPSPRRRGGR